MNVLLLLLGTHISYAVYDMSDCVKHIQSVQPIHQILMAYLPSYITSISKAPSAEARRKLTRLHAPLHNFRVVTGRRARCDRGGHIKGRSCMASQQQQQQQQQRIFPNNVESRLSV
jgi:hypothetical protein